VSRSSNRIANRWENFRARAILQLEIFEREAVLDAAMVQKIRDVLYEVHDESRHLRLEKIMRSDLQTVRALKAKS
jgi:hypothetical protein